MEAIAAYPSSDEEADDHFDCQSIHPSPSLDPSNIKLPSPTNLLPDPHQGRLRSFQPTQGTHPLQLYLTLSLTPPQQTHITHIIITKYLLPLIPDLHPISLNNDNDNANDLLHISLSRTVPAIPRQKTSFIQSIKQCFQRINWKLPSHVSIDTSKLSVFVNDDGTRTFIALLIDTSSNSTTTTTGGGSSNSTVSHHNRYYKDHHPLLTALQLSDLAFKLHGFQQYYDDPQLHVSIAWVLGNQGDKLRAIVDRYNNNSSSSSVAKKVMAVKYGSVMCRYGIESTRIWS